MNLFIRLNTTRSIEHLGLKYTALETTIQDMVSSI